MKFTLSFATRYNGVYLCYESSDDIPEGVSERDVEKVCDEVADTFPSLTYEMVDKFDTDLTDEQKEELCEKAAAMLRPIIPDAVVEFEYDTHSS